jgi:hypothetical protein
MGRRYKLEGASNRYIQLYDEIRRVGNKISRSGNRLGREDQKNFYYFTMLEFYVNGVLLQSFRIKEHRARMKQAEKNLDMMSAQMKGSRIEDLRSKGNEMSEIIDEELVVPSYVMRFDIHYFVVCVDKILKLYPQLLNAMVRERTGEENIDEIKHQKKGIAEKFKLIQEGSRIGMGKKNVRNFLEHIDTVIGDWKGGKSPLNFTFHQHPENDTVIYSDRYSISVDPKPVIEAYESLVNWIESLPELK